LFLYRTAQKPTGERRSKLEKSAFFQAQRRLPDQSLKKQRAPPRKPLAGYLQSEKHAVVPLGVSYLTIT
jgi:hypothetical protein